MMENTKTQFDSLSWKIFFVFWDNPEACLSLDQLVLETNRPVPDLGQAIGHLKAQGILEDLSIRGITCFRLDPVSKKLAHKAKRWPNI